MRSHVRALVVEPGRHTYSQSELRSGFTARLPSYSGMFTARKMASVVSERSAIQQRHLEHSLEEIASRRDWIRVVNEATESLLIRTVARLRSEVPDEKWDGFIVVTSSHYGFPSASRQVQERCGIPLDALCHDLAGLGCAATTHGLHVADMLLRTGSCRSVCLVCVDTMATHGECRGHADKPSMEQIVAHTLASDGAAALLLTRDEHPDDLLSFEDCRLTDRLWVDALDLNAYSADEQNEPFMLVGKDIRTRFADELRQLLDNDAQRDPILMHPGGTALMQIVEEQFPLLKESAAFSKRVLMEHGNLGAPSLLWVLHSALRAGLARGPRLNLFALGPGIVTSLLQLQSVEVAK